MSPPNLKHFHVFFLPNHIFHGLIFKVLVVGGGFFGQEIDDYPYIRYQDIASTETFTLGSNAWSVSAPLPRAMGRFASVSLNNKIYFIGDMFLLSVSLEPTYQPNLTLIFSWGKGFYCI